MSYMKSSSLIFPESPSTKRGESDERREPWDCFRPDTHENLRTRHAMAALNDIRYQRLVVELLIKAKAFYFKFFKLEGKRKCFTDEGMFYSNLIGSCIELFLG